MKIKELLNQLLKANAELQAELEKQLATTDNPTDDDDNDGIELARMLSDILVLWANRKKIADRQAKEIKKVDATIDGMDCRIAKQDFEQWMLFEGVERRMRIIKMKYKKRLPKEIQQIFDEIGNNVGRMIQRERTLLEFAERKEDEIHRIEHPELYEPEKTREHYDYEPELVCEYDDYDDWER